MCRGTKALSKNRSATQNDPDTKTVMQKYKEFFANNDEFENDDCFIINILSCVLSACVLPTIKNKYSVEEVCVYYDCHYENKGMKIKDK